MPPLTNAQRLEVLHYLPDEQWARKTEGRCLFGQIVKDRSGVGMSGQLDTLFT